LKFEEEEYRSQKSGVRIQEGRRTTKKPERTRQHRAGSKEQEMIYKEKKKNTGDPSGVRAAKSLHGAKNV